MSGEPKTANQLVAYNLARIRKSLGLSQEQAAERLEPYLGIRWSKAVYSAAERSYQSSRVRQFTADDLLAMSLAFGVPVTYFFLPPPEDDRDGAERVTGGGHSIPWHDLALIQLGADPQVFIMPRLRELPDGEVEPLVWETQGGRAWRNDVIRQIEDIQQRLPSPIDVDQIKRELKEELVRELQDRLPARPADDADWEQ